MGFIGTLNALCLKRIGGKKHVFNTCTTTCTTIGNKRVHIGDSFSIWYIAILIEKHTFGSLLHPISVCTRRINPSHLWVSPLAPTKIKAGISIHINTSRHKLNKDEKFFLTWWTFNLICLHQVVSNSYDKPIIALGEGRRGS